MLKAHYHGMQPQAVVDQVDVPHQPLKGVKNAQWTNMHVLVKWKVRRVTHGFGRAVRWPGTPAYAL